MNKSIKERYTLGEAEKAFGISVRKLSFLIRNDIIEPIVEGGSLFIPHVELEDYVKLPRKVRHGHHASYLKTLGPGLITGASDDDPSGIGTYSTVGSTYGLKLSWFAIYLLPMMISVQETVARIGIVTNKGLAGAISKCFGKKVLYPLVFLLLAANTINIGADIGAMVASLQLIVPINFYLGAFGLTLIITILIIMVPYHQYARFLKWLTLSLLAYIITGFIIQPDWSEVGASLFIPRVELNFSFFAAMVAVMGTTITPYLFFWQASEEVEEVKDKGQPQDHKLIATKREIKEMRKDTFSGMALANLVFLFIVITTAFVLNKNGITSVDSAQEAASALKPLAGSSASILFAVGILGVGLLAVPVLAGSSAYAISELLKWHEGLSQRFEKAKGFYSIIIISMLLGLFINFFGFNPIKLLYFAAIINGIVSPILLFFIFKLGNNKKVMGQFTNPLWVNIWGWLTTALMVLSILALIFFMFVG